MLEHNRVCFSVMLSMVVGPAALCACGPQDDTVPPVSEADTGADVVDAGELPLPEAGADVARDGQADSNGYATG